MPQKKQSTEYISLTQAAQGTPYSQEYLSLRARQGKLKAVKQGRAWVTTRGWVREYIESSSWDQKKEVYNSGGQEISPKAQKNFTKGAVPASGWGPVSDGKKQAYTSTVQYTQNKKQVRLEVKPVEQNISQNIEDMCVPQPPKHLLSFWARMGAVCTLCTRVILSQVVLERVLVGSLIGIIAGTALLGFVGLSRGPQPPSSGPLSHIIAGMEVVWHKADEIMDEWGRSRERVIARELIEQQTQSKVAGVKIYADDENADTSWTNALADGMNTVVEKIINAVRLDQ